MKYRKKPVVVEAEQFTEESKNRVFRWAGEQRMNVYPTVDENGRPALCIPTLEGEMIARLGDYVIRGVSGELYPCKPDIFAQTYDADCACTQTCGRYAPRMVKTTYTANTTMDERKGAHQMNDYTADCDRGGTSPKTPNLNGLAAELDNQIMRTMEIARAVTAFLGGNGEPEDQGVPMPPEPGLLGSLSGTLYATARLRVEAERIAALLGADGA